MEAGAGTGRLCREVLRAEPDCARGAALRAGRAVRDRSGSSSASCSSSSRSSTRSGRRRPDLRRRDARAGRRDRPDRQRARGAPRAHGRRRRHRQRAARQPAVRPRRARPRTAGSRSGSACPTTGAFYEVPVRASEEIVTWLDDLDAPVGTRLPVQRAIEEWIDDCAARLRRGVVLLLDYAAELDELVARGGEWLRTYRDHGRGTDPLDEPGSQDITTDVLLPTLRRDAAPGRVHDRARVEPGRVAAQRSGSTSWSRRAGRAGRPARPAAISTRSRAGAGSPRPRRSPIPPASAPTPSSSSPRSSDAPPVLWRQQTPDSRGRDAVLTPKSAWRVDSGAGPRRGNQMADVTLEGTAGGGADVPAARGLRARCPGHGPSAPRRGRRRSGGVLGRAGRRAPGLVEALGHRPGLGPAVREVVRRRRAERFVQLRRPPRRGRPRRPGRVPLGGRARRLPHDHLRPAPRRREPGRQRVEGARRARRATGSRSTSGWCPSSRSRCSRAPGSARRTPWCSAGSPRTRCATGSTTPSARCSSPATARGGAAASCR